jgi:hypothetical protein
MTDQTQSSIDDILDATLDDLADAPSIVPFPNGAHKVTMKFKIKDEVPAKLSVQVECTYIEKIELSTPTDVPPAPGDKSFVFIQLKKKDGTRNEFGEGALKEILKVLKPAFPGATNKEVLKNADGCTAAIATKIKVGKGEYEGRDQMELVSIALV